MRAVKDGACGSIKIRVFHNGKAFMLPTSISILPQHWDDGVIIGHDRAKKWNAFLKLRLLDIKTEIIKLDVEGKLSAMTAADLKKRLLLLCGAVEEDETPADLFWPVFQEFLATKTNAGTISVYKQTESRLKAFDSHIEKRAFKDIDLEWLNKFDAFMALTAPKRNARNIHLRNVRAVFNYAKKKKITQEYPFTDFKIKAEPSSVQALTIDQIRLLHTFAIDEPHLAKYRDIFMLMTYLRGINAADLFSAKKTDIVNGRLEYVRKKTGTFYSVKIEPEAQEIIDKYAGETYLLNVKESWSNPTDYLRKMDKGLKKIGPMERKGLGGKKVYKPLFPKLASNWARHTYTSLAASLNIPIELASESLGHKIGSPTTNIYIHYMRKQVDEVARKIIDYICK